MPGSAPADTNGNSKGKGKGENKAEAKVGVSANGTYDQATNLQRNNKGKNRSIACTDPELYKVLCDSDDSEEFYPIDRGFTGQNMTYEHLVRRKRRNELRFLYSACYLGASEVSTRHFGGNTFAVIALGCLLEQLEEHQTQGREF